MTAAVSLGHGFAIRSDAPSISALVPVGAFPRFDSRLSRRVAKQILLQSLPQFLEDGARNDNGQHVRADALTAAFARQLEYIYKEIYNVEYPAFRATEFIPLSTEVPAGSLVFTYRMWNKSGTARVIHNFAKDLPSADVQADEFPSPVITLGMSYDFSVIDIQRAAMSQAPIESMKADAARFAIEFLQEQIAAFGSANDGVPGLTNAPGVTSSIQVSTGGTWLAQIAAIGAATPSAPASAVAATQGIAADVNIMKSNIRNRTFGIHTANTLLLPVNLYTALECAPRSPAFTDDTILDYLEKLCNIDIEMWPQLDNLGTTGNGRVMAYEKDPNVLKLVVAQPFTQLPPQPVGLSWIVPCLSQVGGVMVIRPQAVTYMDGLAG